MIILQWLKLLLPIFGDYIKEFINPTAEENRTTRGERIVALIIAVLVLCLTSILDKSMVLSKDLTTAKSALVESQRKVKEREALVKNIKFYLDRCDNRIDTISEKLLLKAKPEFITEVVATKSVYKAPTPIPSGPKSSATYRKFLLDLISEDN